MTLEELSYHHAAQAFLQILARTCQPKFYEADEMEYQEVIPTKK